MKWILLLAIIVIIQYGEVAGYPSKMISENHPIEHTPADKNKKTPESICEYCHLSEEIIRAAYEAMKKKQTVDIFGYHKSPFEDIFLPRSARSPGMAQYLSNSFDDNLARIKEKLDVLERQYQFFNEFSHNAEAIGEKRQQIDQISLTTELRKYIFYFDFLSNPLLAESVSDQWTKKFDDDIDYVKNNLGSLKTNYELVIDHLKEIRATKEQQTGHMFVHHGSFWGEPIKDMIQSRSTRSAYLTDSFNDLFHFIRTTLENLEKSYKDINKLLQAEVNEEKGEQTDPIPSSVKLDIMGTPWTLESPEVYMILSRLNRLFDSDIVNIEENLEVLKIKFRFVINQLKEIAANSPENKKEYPSPSESIVSNNNTQETVTQTTIIPTPDESTNTQKPVPIKHDDKKDKLVDEKDPLHTPEIAPTNKTPENVIIPIESTIFEKLELTTIKNEEKPEQFEQEAENMFISITNNNETFEAPIALDKKIIINPDNPEDSITFGQLVRLLNTT
ncbi:uncharacterized protein LOC105250582 isoform X2 [Camponotus floridanus]|uniref:uncharacterized protein LOC105250582 isoform X2 n=1 Tax=Camponotus floridanus TaxID=104421 RepID=UPI000DC67A3B|nr:uncharacterized protein LOC105250582 isoform X2 [Camponotus floridanus]